MKKLMKKLISIICMGLILLVPIHPVYADHYQGDRGDCNREGNCNDQRRCQGDGCRGSFSPGPFDRSPVDIHDNQFCISPDCSGRSNNDKKNGG